MTIHSNHDYRHSNQDYTHTQTLTTHTQTMTTDTQNITTSTQTMTMATQTMTQTLKPRLHTHTYTRMYVHTDIYTYMICQSSYRASERSHDPASDRFCMNVATPRPRPGHAPATPRRVPGTPQFRSGERGVALQCIPKQKTNIMESSEKG